MSIEDYTHEGITSYLRDNNISFKVLQKPESGSSEGFFLTSEIEIEEENFPIKEHLGSTTTRSLPKWKQRKPKYAKNYWVYSYFALHEATEENLRRMGFPNFNGIIRYRESKLMERTRIYIPWVLD